MLLHQVIGLVFGVFAFTSLVSLASALYDVGLERRGTTTVTVRYANELFARHGDENHGNHGYGYVSLTAVTTVGDVITVYTTDCLTTEISGTASETTAIETTPVDYKTVVTHPETTLQPTTATSSVVKHVPETTPGVYTPVDIHSTVTQQSIQTVQTCPPGGCYVSVETTQIPITSVDTTPVYPTATPAEDIPTTVVPEVKTITSTTTASKSRVSSTAIPTYNTPTPSAPAVEGAGGGQAAEKGLVLYMVVGGFAMI